MKNLYVGIGIILLGGLASAALLIGGTMAFRLYCAEKAWEQMLKQVDLKGVTKDMVNNHWLAYSAAYGAILGDRRMEEKRVSLWELWARNNTVPAMYYAECDGAVITAPCKVNLETKQVFDIGIDTPVESIHCVDGKLPGSCLTDETVYVGENHYALFRTPYHRPPNQNYWYHYSANPNVAFVE